MRTESVSANQLVKANSIYKSLKKTAPRNRADLANYIRAYLGINISDVKLCDGHDSPMDYLWHSYSCDFNKELTCADCVVWAGRGGGKTLIAAIATLLDSIFKQGCQTRILAGSEQQAHRMYDYLLGFLNNGFEEFLSSPALKNSCTFLNGSKVEVLTQSASSVRGSHIHKLRCDEIELFNPQILEAAKFIPKSDNDIIGSMECLSTMHQPFGLMHDLVSKSADNGTRVFKWCIWEVIEKCTNDRSCSRCPMNNYCRGKARKANGYFKIDDCISQMRRSSKNAFESEMLCLRPSLENIVFAEFNPDIHVASVDYNPALPLYRAIDFGFVNPFACLWIQVADNGGVIIFDEYIKSRLTIDCHFENLRKKTPCLETAVTATFCDPAGAGVNDVTGTSAVSRLRSLGMRLRYKRSSILDGIELIRRALRSGDGKSRLIISPRCSRLIEAMSCYHYPPAGALDELPLKDGVYDHPIDALRYFFVNYLRPNTATSRKY